MELKLETAQIWKTTVKQVIQLRKSTYYYIITDLDNTYCEIFFASVCGSNELLNNLKNVSSCTPPWHLTMNRPEEIPEEDAINCDDGQTMQNISDAYYNLITTRFNTKISGPPCKRMPCNPPCTSELILKLVKWRFSKNKAKEIAEWLSPQCTL